MASKYEDTTMAKFRIFIFVLYASIFYLCILFSLIYHQIFKNNFLNKMNEITGIKNEKWPKGKLKM